MFAAKKRKKTGGALRNTCCTQPEERRVQPAHATLPWAHRQSLHVPLHHHRHLVRVQHLVLQYCLAASIQRRRRGGSCCLSVKVGGSPSDRSQMTCKGSASRLFKGWPGEGTARQASLG